VTNELSLRLGCVSHLVKLRPESIDNDVIDMQGAVLRERPSRDSSCTGKPLSVPSAVMTFRSGLCRSVDQSGAEPQLPIVDTVTYLICPSSKMVFTMTNY
jgi:hypothetical protein